MKHGHKHQGSSPEREEMKGAPFGERLPYPGGFPVYLARYVLLGGEQPHVAMRFFNASEILVTGIVFRLTEKDGAGNVIGEYPLERTNLFAERGVEFAVADAPVKRECASVEVSVQSVLSEGYTYATEKDGVRLLYGERAHEREYHFGKEAKYSLSKRRKWYVLAAVFTVIAAVLIALGVAWRVGAFEKRDQTPEPEEVRIEERISC